MSRPKTHGRAVRGKIDPAYRTWSGMWSRCTNPNDSNYSRYGAKGIKVCKRWKKFENFLSDMGERPEGKSLDRWPNNKGDYKPSNCRWATPKEQSANADHSRSAEWIDRHRKTCPHGIRPTADCTTCKRAYGAAYMRKIRKRRKEAEAAYRAMELTSARPIVTELIAADAGVE